MIVEWFVVWPVVRLSAECAFDALACEGYIFGQDLGTPEPPVVDGCRDTCGTSASKWIEDEVVLVCKREDQALNQADWELAWVLGLFDVVTLYVGDVPDVFWVFASWVA